MPKLTTSIRVMILTKQLMVLCQHTHPQILKLSSYTLMVIFAMSFKFGIITNGLGIIRHISFYNKDFMISHPEIVVEKKSDSPDEDKCVHDANYSFLH